MMKKTFAVWDLGATKCAAAIVDYDVQSDDLECLKSCRIKLRACQSLDELVERIESELGCKMSDTDAICIAAAGRFTGEIVELEKGYPYPMEFGRVARERRWRNFEVIHDYVPVACVTFTKYLSHPDNVTVLNKGRINQFGRRVSFGVGSGLGLKDFVLLPNGDFWFESNEAGHIGVPFPPMASRDMEQRHIEFVEFMRKEGGLKHGEPFIFEKILSGRGLTRIHHFLTGETGYRPEEISEQFESGKFTDTIKMMAWYVGLFIGTAQLMYMPTGGTWISGGVMLKNPCICQQPELFDGIYATPAYRHVRENFPLYAIRGRDYALIGCAYYASRRMFMTPTGIGLNNMLSAKC